MRGSKDDPAAEIPDLVIEPSAGRPAASARVSAAQVTAAQVTVSSPLDLELGGDPTQPSCGGTILTSDIDLFGGAATDDVFELGLELEPLAAPLSGSPGTANARGAASRATAPWPTGTTPGEEELQIAPTEVERLAAFGAAPSFLLATPVYAVRVWRRRRVLQAQTAVAQRSFDELERARDDAVARIAEAVRPLLDGNDRYHTSMLELRTHEGAIADAEADLSASDAELQAQESDLEGRLEEAATRLRTQEQTTAEERGGVDAARGRLGRVEVQQKRLEIERRALLDVARRKLGPEGGALPPEVATPLAQLEAREAALRPGLDQARGELEAAQTRLTATERAAELTRRDLLELRGRRDAAAARRHQAVAERSRSLDEARARRRGTLLELGRAVLAMRGHVPVDEESLESVRVLDARVREAATQLERLRLAPLACDSVAMQRGVWILGLTTAAAVASPFLL